MVMVGIQLQSVCVEYPIFGASTKSFKRAFLHVTTGGMLKTYQHHTTIQALRNITLELFPGDRVGLLGHNGSGKTTLLRVLAGIYEPHSGICRVVGSLTAILNLLSGINPEATGYENIRWCSLIHGLSPKDIEQNTKKIAEFSGLGDYLSLPAHTYSAGMLMRLAFSITATFTSDILLLDEVVETGDAAFQELAQMTFNKILERASIVVLSTHNTASILKYCNKLILMSQGQITFFGPVTEGLVVYHKGHTFNQTKASTEV